MDIPVISPTGISCPSFATVLSQLKDQFRSIYGSDIYIESDSQDGQMIAVFAQAVSDTYNFVTSAYFAFSPLTAQGLGLSSVVKINGIRRLVPSNSTALVRVSGTVGTEINNGKITDPSNTQVLWNLPAVVDIPDAGFIDVTATCESDGAIAAAAGTLTRIATPVRGWQTVTNAADAAPGAPVENDATLRRRQTQSTALPALTVRDALQGALQNLPGVLRAFVYDNDTGATDANGIPAHSICAVVEGGDAATIAETIALYKGPGAGTYGSTTETVLDPKGIPVTIHFDLLGVIEMAVLAPTLAGAGYVTTTADLIKASVVQFLDTLAIGQDSQLNKLWSPINLSGDAATTATGQTQTQLDAFSATYNTTAIYQARKDNMVLTVQENAGNNTFAVADASNYAVGQPVAVVLDDGSRLYTVVTNVTALIVTTLANVPGGRNAPVGALMYVGGDVAILFNEAAGIAANDVTIPVT